ncbi:MAG: LacI family transcriptional regulator [Candidatus Omnitrophica bacterium]|nr:LacI family transcriptional regulator [Candidatus Omnitrophota bacterium]
MSSKITIKDVARKAGVSIATVSRFINNFPLRQENKDKVERAINELNYQPLLYARRLAGGKLNTFGLILPGYEGIFYSFYALEIIREVAASTAQNSIDLHLNIFWDKDNFQSSLVDGVIMADVIGNDQQLERLTKEEVPLIVINRRIDDPRISSISVDNFKGAYEAVEFLIHHGHKRIAHLAGDLRVQCSQERIDGYKSALVKNKIEFREDYVKSTNFSRKDAREGLDELFAKVDEAPTAIFCCSDEVASEVLSFAEEKRIEVPRSLSVIGFDDNPHCLYGNLMLTTVRQPLKAMVQQGVKILKDTIDENKPPQKLVLDTELIIRDTVGFL